MTKKIYKEANEFIAPDEQLLNKILLQVDKPKHSPMTRRMYMAGSLAAGVAAVAVSAAVFPEVMEYSNPKVEETKLIGSGDIEDRVKDSYGLFKKMQPDDVTGQGSPESSPLPKLGINVYPGEAAQYVPGANINIGGASGNSVSPAIGAAIAPRTESGGTLPVVTPSPAAVQTQQPSTEALQPATNAPASKTEIPENTNTAASQAAPQEMPQQTEEIRTDESGSNAIVGSSASSGSVGTSSDFSGSVGAGAPMVGSTSGGGGGGSAPARVSWTLDGFVYNGSEVFENGTVYHYTADNKELSVTVTVPETELVANYEINSVPVQLTEEVAPVLQFDLDGERYILEGNGLTVEELKQFAEVIITEAMK